jgi:O-antigen/teichoic acid export membrane protein
VIIAWSATVVLAGLFGFVNVMRVTSWRLLPSPYLLKRSMQIGYRSWITVLGIFLMLRIHAFLFTALLSDPDIVEVQTADFSVCFRSFNLLQRFSNIVGIVLFAKIVQESRKKSFEMTVKIIRNVLMISLSLSLILAVTGKLFILIISSDEYVTAYIPLLIMLPGIICINIGTIMNNVYWGHGYQWKIILAPYAASVLIVLLDMHLIPAYGVAGATFTFSLAACIWFLYVAFWYRVDSGIPLKDIFIPKKEDFRFMYRRFKSILPGTGS